MDTTRPSAAGGRRTGSPDLDLPAGQVVGEYRIETRLAAGGMGTVYAAVHPIIGKKAAIKVLKAEHSQDEGLIQRFIDEARAVNHIGHEHIVDIFSFGTLEDGRSYFVMEWLEGESLKAALQDRSIPFFDACAILVELCGALQAAHEKGIVHRDLKPDNVFLEARGDRTVAKLLDFGIAKLTDRVRPNSVTDSSPDAVMGTPDYIAPEQALGQPTTHAADVYGLGVMMYELFVGQRPFFGSSPVEVIVKHVNEPPPAPRSLRPQVPPSLENLLLRMLDKDPAMRPTVEQVRLELCELERAARLSSGLSSSAASRFARPVLTRRGDTVSGLVRTLLTELSAPACWVDCGGPHPRVGTPIRLRFEVPRLDLQLDFDGVLGGVFGSAGDKVLVRYDQVSKDILDRVVELGSGVPAGSDSALHGQWIQAGRGGANLWARFLGQEEPDLQPDPLGVERGPTGPAEGVGPQVPDRRLEPMEDMPSRLAPLSVKPTRPWLGLGAKVLALVVAMSVLAVASVSLIALRQTRIDRAFYVQDQNLTAARSVAAALERQAQVWRKQLQLTLAQDTYLGPKGEFSGLAVCDRRRCTPVLGPLPAEGMLQQARARLQARAGAVWAADGRLWTSARLDAEEPDPGGPKPGSAGTTEGRYAVAEVPLERIRELSEVAPNVDLSVVTEAGEVVVRSGPPSTGQLRDHPLLTDALGPSRSGAQRYDTDPPVLGAWSQVEGGLRVVAASPESVTREQIQVLSQQVGAVAASVLLVASLLALLLSSTTTRRLRQLAQQARRVAEGDFTQTASVRGTDEVRELAGYFARMTEALQERDDQVLAAQQAMAADEVLKVQQNLSTWLEQDLATRLEAIQSELKAPETAERSQRLVQLAQQASNSLQSAILFSARRRNRVDVASCAREACEQVERVPVRFSAPNAALLPWVEADESKVRELFMLILQRSAQAARGPMQVQLSQTGERTLSLYIRVPAAVEQLAGVAESVDGLARSQGATLRCGHGPADSAALAVEFAAT